MFKKIGFIFTWIFIIINFLLGLLGVSSVFLTLSFYALLGFGLARIFAGPLVDTQKKTDYKLFAVTLLVGLFITELILRFGVRSYLSYGEENGNFFYYSPYKQTQLYHFTRTHLLKQKDQQLRVHVPNTSSLVKKREYEYMHSFNSVGLRGSEILKGANERTIVCLGDSFTEGEGAPGDSTWPVMLERALCKVYDPQKFKCINGGSSGSDPFYEYILLERELLRYTPEMIIVSINQSDIYDVIVKGGLERFKADGSMAYRHGPWWEFFYQFSFIFRNIIHSARQLNRQLMSDEQYKSETESALFKIKQCIEVNFKNLSAKKRFKLVVVLHPLQHELEQEQFSLEPLWESFKSDTSFVTINLFNEIKEKKKKQGFHYKELYWHTDLHHNSSGYRLYGNIVSEQLFRKSDNN